MNLRDEFAMVAMRACIKRWGKGDGFPFGIDLGRHQGDEVHAARLSRVAYLIADGMLAAREESK